MLRAWRSRKGLRGWVERGRAGRWSAEGEKDRDGNAVVDVDVDMNMAKRHFFRASRDPPPRKQARHTNPTITASSKPTSAINVSTEPPQHPLPPSCSQPTTMATDEEYMAFLDKANRDPNEGYPQAHSSTTGGTEFKATDEGAEVPAVLVGAAKDTWYSSDADERFQVVSLKLAKGKGLPDEVTFAALIQHPTPAKAEVSILDIAEWDPSGGYKDVVDAVRAATKGSDVRVYRIVKKGTRAEYWVVGTEGGRLLGVKALAVES